jgi:hypothetical protein
MSNELVAAGVQAASKSAAKKRFTGRSARPNRKFVNGLKDAVKRAKNKASTPTKAPYESRARVAIPHGKRSNKLESRASKIGGRANAAYAAGKYKRSGKLAAKASKFHGKADRASGKYQAKQAKKTSKLSYGALAT